MLKFLFLSFLIFSSIILPAQERDLKFDHISTEDGLSSSWINAIYEDQNGYIWFGTSDGLNRYDASSIKVYKPDEAGEHDMILTGINHIMSYSDEELLICSDVGASLFNLNTEEFKPFPYLENVRVTYAIKDRDDKIWFTTYSGLFNYSSTDSAMVSYKHDPLDETSIGNNQLTTCYFDKRNELWIGTTNGLDYFDRNTNSFHHFLYAV